MRSPGWSLLSLENLKNRHYDNITGTDLPSVLYLYPIFMSWKHSPCCLKRGLRMLAPAFGP